MAYLSRGDNDVHKKSEQKGNRVEQYFIDLKNYLKSLEPISFEQKVEKFWKQGFKEMTCGDISASINSVLMVKSRFTIPVVIKMIPPGTQLFRIRHVSKDFIPCDGDCWAPPKEKVLGGRINKEGVPWLYTSPSLDSVFLEMLIPRGKIAMLIIYKALEEIRCSSPDFSSPVDDQNESNLTRKEIEKLHLVRSFLHDLFSVEVAEGSEYLYKISQSFVTDFVDYPMCTAVYYPAVEAPGYHVAIKGQNRNQVKLSSVKMINNVDSSIDNKQLKFELLRSYDERLFENTQCTQIR